MFTLPVTCNAGAGGPSSEVLPFIAHILQSKTIYHTTPSFPSPQCLSACRLLIGASLTIDHNILTIRHLHRIVVASFSMLMDSQLWKVDVSEQTLTPVLVGMII